MLTENDLIAYLENTLSPDDRQRVEVELEREPQQRRQLLRQAQMASALRIALSDASANDRVKQSVLAVIRGEQEGVLKGRVLADMGGPASHEARSRVRLTSLYMMKRWAESRFALLRPAFAFGSFAACVLLFACLWFLRSGASFSPGIEIPTQVILSSGALAPKPGDMIRSGATTSATVTFSDGTIFHLEPGTEIRLEAVDTPLRAGGKQFKLLAGAVSATVARQPEGLPLLIQTPHALVTVVGTEFDLNVAMNQTELDVTHGLVKITDTSEAHPVSVAAGEFAVTSPHAPLRYGRLARHPFHWPFSSTSVWNRALGSDAQFSPIPGPPLLEDGALQHALRPRRPFVGSATDPLRRIWVGGEVCGDIRLSDANLPKAGLGDSLVLLQQARRYALELRGVSVRSDGDLEAQAMSRTDLAGPGVENASSPAKPFRFSNLGGLLRTGEWENGIRHALSARVSRERLAGLSNTWPQTVWPAGDGTAATQTSLGVGSLLALPPSVDIRALFGASGPAYELARAMQDYGLYVTGPIDAPFVLLTDDTRFPGADDLITRLVPLLQVVVSNAPDSPAGGGSPRREPAPAFPGEAE